MVPTTFIHLDELPLTANGKVDRKALPKLDKAEIESSGEFVEPHTEVEKKLSETWQEVLKIEKVGIKDNFFELGGDSVIAILVITKAKNLSPQSPI